MLLGFLTLAGALGSAIVSSLWAVILFREIVGVGVGLASAVCPVYVSEHSPPNLKGALGATFQVCLTSTLIVQSLSLSVALSLSLSLSPHLPLADLYIHTHSL
jgi:MFS family permease